jgi:membrane fusion protein, multidrug efflux system
MRVQVEDMDGKPPLRVGMSVTVDVDTGHVRGVPDFVTNLIERGKSLLALARGEKAHG